jgi:NAD(P)-dependent dehydrogenase (short-subunit alcohol dehydrogenase family)
MLSWLVWLPWVVLVVIVVALFRWKQATHVVADPANARGKWVCVTGAAQGIGRATACELLRLGANVYAADINAAGLDEAFAGFGEDRVVKLRVDVTKQADVDELARRCAKHGVYAVVNSAGVASPPGQKRTVLLGAAELDVDADMLPVFNINVFGTARVNSALFPMIFEANGTIVNIASIAGRLAAPGMAVYAAAKHAVVAYSASCRRELAPYNVRVFCVEPGFTETPMVTTTLHPAGPDLSRTRVSNSCLSVHKLC